MLGREDDLPLAVRQAHALQAVPFLQGDGDNAVPADVAEILEHGALGDPVLGEQDERRVVLLAGFGIGNERAHVLVPGQFQEIMDGPALGGPGSGRYLVDLGLENPALVGEEQNVVVGRRREEVRQEILLRHFRTDQALAAAALGVEGRRRQAFDVAAGGKRDHHFFLRDQVLVLEGAHPGRHHLGPAVVAVFVPKLLELFLDDPHYPGGVLEDKLELRDQGPFFLEFGLHFFPLQRRQSRQAHFQDRRGLRIGKFEMLHQIAVRVLLVFGPLDDRDDLVYVRERLDQAFQDVRALLGFAEIELRPAADHHLPVIEVREKYLLYGQKLGGDPVRERDHVHVEILLQVRVLVELVQYFLGRHVALELDHKPQALAVGLVAHVPDAFDLLVLHELRDVLHQFGFVHLVGYLGHHYVELAVLALLDLRLGPGHDRAPAGRVRLPDGLGVENDAAGREVRALDEIHDVVVARAGLLREKQDGVRHFAQVVGRHAGRHADRDAQTAVQKQVGELRGQDLGLFPRRIVVRLPIHGLLLDVRKHLVRDAREARLGIAHGRGRIAVDGTEVALALHQRVTQGEVLGHADQGVVDGRVAVRMVLAHGLADHVRGLAELGLIREPRRPHGPQYPPVHGLQSVPDVRQGARHDDRHRVAQIGLPKLAGYLSFLYSGHGEIVLIGLDRVLARGLEEAAEAPHHIKKSVVYHPRSRAHGLYERKAARLAGTVVRSDHEIQVLHP